MQVLRSPVVQFLAAGSVIVLAVVLGTDYLGRRAAQEEAVTDARVTTELLAHSVAEPLIPDGLEHGSPIAVNVFDRLARERLLVGNVQVIKIWNTDGEIVYSDNELLIGDRFELSAAARQVLAGGKSAAGLADPRSLENRFEMGEDGLLEVYTRIETDSGEPLLFEVYYSPDELEETTDLVFGAFRPITLGGLLALALLATPLIWALTRRLDRAAQARVQLLRSAVEASDAERRRIARQLHEGVLRDLTDVSASLAAEAGTIRATAPTNAQRLLGVDDSLRRNIDALRSMVLQIYPPDLDADRLAGALDELTAPARAAGIDVAVDVDDIAGASDDSVALVWRGAQEAVRNAVRHARGSRLEVSVRRTGRLLSLRVSDDGVGFVPGAFSSSGQFGLRSLNDLATEVGGRLDVQSGPGRGTVVRLDVPERVPTR